MVASEPLSSVYAPRKRLLTPLLSLVSLFLPPSRRVLISLSLSLEREIERLRERRTRRADKHSFERHHREHQKEASLGGGGGSP